MWNYTFPYNRDTQSITDIVVVFVRRNVGSNRNLDTRLETWKVEGRMPPMLNIEPNLDD